MSAADRSATTIHKVTADDIPELAAQLAPLHKRLFATQWQAAAFRDMLRHRAVRSFIARSGPDDTLSGFVLFQIAADEAEIWTFGVAPEMQRQGIGRQLLGAMMAAAKRAGVTRVVLEVAVENEAALGLYRALSFTEVGRRSDYYATPGCKPGDACVLALEL